MTTNLTDEQKKDEEEIFEQLEKKDRERKEKDEKDEERQGDDDDAGDEQDDDESRDIRKPRVPRAPRQPTKQEIADHYPLHLQYRSWCDICVKAAGIHDHKGGNVGDKEEKALGITLGMDYAFMNEDLDLQEEEDETTASTILVIHDSEFDAVFALQVAKKGIDDFACQWVINKLEELGHTGSEITLKSDQEASIMALKRQIAMRRQVRTPMVESQVRV